MLRKFGRLEAASMKQAIEMLGWRKRIRHAAIILTTGTILKARP